MGLRFHKSIKLGKLLKLNINKNSISLSAGVKGAHITVNNKGKKTASVGLPGTGLSYQKTLSSGKKKSSSKKSKTNDIAENIKESLSGKANDFIEDTFGIDLDGSDNKDKE